MTPAPAKALPPKDTAPAVAAPAENRIRQVLLMSREMTPKTAAGA